MLLLGCTKQLIQPIENEPMVSVPERPDKMMGYFRQVDTGKEKLWCVSDNVHFLLDQEITRYVAECESCPAWKGR